MGIWQIGIIIKSASVCQYMMKLQHIVCAMYESTLGSIGMRNSWYLSETCQYWLPIKELYIYMLCVQRRGENGHRGAKSNTNQGAFYFYDA